jgi:hypothetical protein
LIPQKFLPNHSPFFSTTTLEDKNLQKLLQCMRLSWIWCTLILEPRICVPCPERTCSAPKDVGRAKLHSLAIVPTLGPQQQVLSVPRYQRCDGSPTLPIHNWPAIHNWWEQRETQTKVCQLTVNCALLFTLVFGLMTCVWRWLHSKELHRFTTTNYIYIHIY